MSAFVKIKDIFYIFYVYSVLFACLVLLLPFRGFET